MGAGDGTTGAWAGWVKTGLPPNNAPRPRPKAGLAMRAECRRAGELSMSGRVVLPRRPERTYGPHVLPLMGRPGERGRPPGHQHFIRYQSFPEIYLAKECLDALILWIKQ